MSIWSHLLRRWSLETLRIHWSRVVPPSAERSATVVVVVTQLFFMPLSRWWTPRQIAYHKFLLRENTIDRVYTVPTPLCHISPPPSNVASVNIGMWFDRSSLLLGWSIPPQGGMCTQRQQRQQRQLLQISFFLNYSNARFSLAAACCLDSRQQMTVTMLASVGDDRGCRSASILLFFHT